MAKVVALISSGRYRQEHYEDVAGILSVFNGTVLMEPREIKEEIVYSFAYLFATDNPHKCYVDGDHDGECDDGCMRGFDRKRFLAACGLEA